MTVHLHLVKQKEKLSCWVMYHMQTGVQRSITAGMQRTLYRVLGSTGLQAFRTSSTRLAKVHCAPWVTLTSVWLKMAFGETDERCGQSPKLIGTDSQASSKVGRAINKFIN